MAEQSKKKKTSGASPEIVDIPEDAVVPSKGKGGKAAGEKAKAASNKPKASSAKPEATAAKPEATAAKPKTAKKKASTDKPSTPRKPSKPRKVKVEPGISRSEATESRRRHPRRAVPRGKLADMSEDMFLEEWDERPRRKHGRKRDQRTVAVNLLLIAAILALVTVGGMLIHRRQAFLEMKQVVEAQTFYDGTTVEGVDVSNMTLNAAKDYWQRDIEPNYADRAVMLDGRGTVTARELGYQSDYEAVLSNAWSAGRRGSLEERYHAAVSRQYNPVAYTVTRREYSDEAMDAYIQAIADKVDRPAVDAAIQSFDTSTYAFVFSDSSTGSHLDAAGLKASIAQALEAGGGGVSLPIETVEPRVTKEAVSSAYGMISSAVTNASSSSTNRLKNIELALSFINGTCLKPGETFSFNGTVGKRTTDRGFRRATAYSGGEVTEEVGGGICQVSTTLFNAAVKADMQIVERHSHSLTVSYVDRGKDAAVNWDSQDLKFTNNSQDDVYICCFLSPDKRIRFGMFGRMLENGETITLDGVTTETIKYDTRYEPSPFLMPGETKVLSGGKNGYRAEAYKIRWDAAGNQISRELLCKSSYKSRDEVIQYGR